MAGARYKGLTSKWTSRELGGRQSRLTSDQVMRGPQSASLERHTMASLYPSSPHGLQPQHPAPGADVTQPIGVLCEHNRLKLSMSPAGNRTEATSHPMISSVLVPLLENVHLDKLLLEREVSAPCDRSGRRVQGHVHVEVCGC